MMQWILILFEFLIKPKGGFLLHRVCLWGNDINIDLMNTNSICNELDYLFVFCLMLWGLASPLSIIFANLFQSARSLIEVEGHSLTHQTSEYTDQLLTQAHTKKTLDSIHVECVFFFFLFLFLFVIWLLRRQASYASNEVYSYCAAEEIHIHLALNTLAHSFKQMRYHIE